jgi:hypothetical protein
MDTRTTSPAWQAHHRRSAALRDVVAGLEQDGRLAWDDEVFADRDDVLVALHDLWARRLLARVDTALELDSDDAVDDAWRGAAASMPAVRRVLDEHADLPTLAAGERNEHRMVAVAAGLATLGDPVAYAAARGREHVAGLRAVRVPRQHGPVARVGQWLGLADRLSA